MDSDSTESQSQMTRTRFESFNGWTRSNTAVWVINVYDIWYWYSYTKLIVFVEAVSTGYVYIKLGNGILGVSLKNYFAAYRLMSSFSKLNLD